MPPGPVAHAAGRGPIPSNVNEGELIMARRIRVTVDLPWPGVPNVTEYYDLPDEWDEMSEREQDAALRDMGAEELASAGVGYGASVVDDDGEEAGE